VIFVARDEVAPSPRQPKKDAHRGRFGYIGPSLLPMILNIHRIGASYRMWEKESATRPKSWCERGEMRLGRSCCVSECGDDEESVQAHK